MSMKKIGGLMKTLLEENETLTQIVNEARHPPARPTERIHQSISRNFLRKIQLKIGACCT